MLPKISLCDLKNLNKNGIIKTGSIIKNDNVLIGKIKEKKNKTLTSKLVGTIFGRNIFKDISLKSKNSTTGTVINVKVLEKNHTSVITVYIQEKRKIQVGDKIAGRHGNKGIVAKILPIEDMPYLPDGIPLDLILNPLGIPSRMNVGQIFETLLGITSTNLKENYKVEPFLTKTKEETLKKIVYNKLNEAKKRTCKKWLLNPKNLGKITLFDGRDGEKLEQPVTVGYSYILKLMHLVDDKINARLTGPYSLIIKQPIRGKSKNGGQRFGEMEVWAIEGFGAAYTLQELLTIKSDDLNNRSRTLFSIITRNNIPQPNIPESFKTLIIELQCLCLDINIFSKEKKNFLNK